MVPGARGFVSGGVCGSLLSKDLLPTPVDLIVRMRWIGFPARDKDPVNPVHPVTNTHPTDNRLFGVASRGGVNKPSKILAMLLHELHDLPNLIGVQKVKAKVTGQIGKRERQQGVMAQLRFLLGGGHVAGQRRVAGLSHRSATLGKSSHLQTDRGCKVEESILVDRESDQLAERDRLPGIQVGGCDLPEPRDRLGR